MNDNNINDIFMDDLIFSCGHYIRGCKYVSPCCGRIFNCRLCHDAELEKDIENQHTMNNSDTKKIICKKCKFLQDFGSECESCGICFGKYYCPKCKFIDNDDKKKYFHCNDCGICRRGDKDKYEHCNNCNMCFLIGHNETCQNKPSNDECPICFEDLFHSTDPGVPLPCGHMLHNKCYMSSLKSGNAKCPICRKTFARSKQYEAVLKHITQVQQMPEEYKNKKADILCQDCEQKSNVDFHFVAMFCPHCGSHNTTQINSLTDTQSDSSSDDYANVDEVCSEISDISWTDTNSDTEYKNKKREHKKKN
jgi:RING finger and CHY zinc finger domain-containing protein 1